MTPGSRVQRRKQDRKNVRDSEATADEARTAYTQFLKGIIENVLEWIVKEQRIDIIESFVQENILDEKGLDTALKLAGKCGWTEGSASIIELGSRFAQKMKKSRYEF